MNNNIWIEHIIKAIENNGDHARLDDIYNKVEEYSNIDLNEYIDWKSRIRNTIYKYSSDCDIFCGKNVGDENDIFFTVYGKGKGVWGLRKFNNLNNSINVEQSRKTD